MTQININIKVLSMWNKLPDTSPPYYKKLWIWVDNDEYRATFTKEEEWIYWDLDIDEEPKHPPTHWREPIKPSEQQRVCF